MTQGRRELVMRHLGWLIWLVLAGPAWALSDAEVAGVLAGFEARRDAVLDRQVANPYPRASTESDVQTLGWNRLDFALAALYRNVELDRANEALRDLCTRDLQAPIGNGETRFHWLGPLLIRIHELFWSGSEVFPGRLADDVAAAIRAQLWNWARTASDLSRTRPERRWWFWGSENHSAMHDATAWGAARLLARDPAYAGQRYADGTTPAEQVAAWEAFLAAQLADRIGRGLCVEIASDGYSKYTLQTWYNYADFGGPALREAARAALDVWWADWAIDQLDGVRGGGKARCYQGDNQTAGADGARGMAWYYLGLGRPRDAHPALMCLVTSAYQMPPAVARLALNPTARGRYEVVSRRPGRRDPQAGELPPGVDAVDPELPGIRRYSWVTPEVILGCLMLPKLPNAEGWTNISSQNRWQGAIFAGDPDARLFAECEGERNGKTYNQQIAVQKLGSQLVARLPVPFSKQAGRLRVFASPSLPRHQVGDWWIVEAPQAWAATRPTVGTMRDEAPWLVCDDPAAAVLLEVAPRQDYADATAWAAAVQQGALMIADGLVDWTALGGRLTLDTVGDRVPTINGEPVDLQPPMTFDSPFLSERWGSGDVRIGRGADVLTVRIEQP